MSTPTLTGTHIGGNVYIGYKAGTGKTASIQPTITATQQPSNAYWDYFRRIRERYLLEIGKVYLVAFNKDKIRKARFIRSTPRGFNFVDIETKKLLFKKHIYRCKYQDYNGYLTQQDKDDFWVWMDGRITVALPLEEQIVEKE